MGHLRYPDVPLGVTTGLGGGVTPLVGPGANITAPSFHFRVGRLDKVYAVLDFLPPTETPMMSGTGRLGLGVRLESSHRLDALFGFSGGPYGDSRYSRFFAELRGAPTDRLDVGVRAIAGDGYQNPTGGLGVSVRYRIGGQ